VIKWNAFVAVKYPGYVCSKCKEEWFDEEVVDKIEKKVKKIGWRL
jgi:hypothetical protein